MHLNSAELVDLAEGTRHERSAPHLAGCERCRVQLRELRAMLAAAQDVGVPEPSPLFWDHLSARVSDAVSEDARLKGSRSFADRLTALLGTRALTVLRARAFQASVAVAAALLIAVVVSSRSTAPARVSAPVARAVLVSDAPAAPELLDDVTSGDDPSLTLVAILSDEADLETAREAGLAARGSAEHAVTHMSAGELGELRRLLKQEMTRSGA